MEKLLKVAELRNLEKQVSIGEISYSRMVEIINLKHLKELSELRYNIESEIFKKIKPVKFVDPNKEYAVRYTITQSGEKVYKNQMIKGADLTEPQIFEIFLNGML